MTGKLRIVQFDKVKALPADMWFSRLSGFNYYAPTKDTVSVFGVARPVIRHARTGDSFYIIPLQPPYDSYVGGSGDIGDATTDLDHWREIVQHPMPSPRFQWPVDLIQRDHEGQWPYLVFPMMDAGSSWQPIGTLLDNVNGQKRVRREFAEEAGASNPLTLAVARSLLTAWGELLDAQYLYCGFTGNIVFYNPSNGKVRFGFSPAARRLPDFAHQTRSAGPLAWLPGDEEFQGDSACIDEMERYETVHRGKLNLDLDYLDVAGYNSIIETIDRGGQPKIDVLSEQFAITSILFRLLVGRLPYDGKVMVPESNEPGEVHEAWSRTYHRNADFIFDPDNDINHIGNGVTTPADDVFVQNWEALPQGVRDVFVTVLTQGAGRTADAQLRWCRPATWLKRLEGFEAHPLD